MNDTNVDLSSLNMFAAVASHSSFRKAAIELAMPVATLSRKISKLEDTLGTQLFQRTTRTVILTEMGKKLLEDTTDPLSKLDRAIARATHQPDTISGLVKIATTYTLAETNILPLLPKLRRDWPEIRVQILLDEDVVDIRTERVDFAVRAGELQDPSLIARKICTHRFIRYTTPHMQNQPDPGFVTYGKMLRDSNLPAVEVKDIRMVLKLVLANQGEAWLPDALCHDYERRGDLIRITGAKIFAFNVSLVFGSKKFIPKRVRYVMDAIIEHANQFSRLSQDYQMTEPAH